MDDELSRAAHRQRLQQRQRARAAQEQRLRQDAEAREAAATAAALPARAGPGRLGEGNAAPPAASSSSGAPGAAAAVAPRPPPAPTHSPEFKEAVAVKFRELVAGGLAPNEAATRAIKLVRDAASAAAGRGLGAGSSAASEAEEAAVPCPGGPFTCLVCVEHKEASERWLPHDCGGVIPESLCCKPCFVAWVESQIDAEDAVIKSCYCDRVLDAHELARLVSPEHWLRYSAAALQRTLRRDASFVWCSKCPGGGWVDPKQPTSKCGWTCPECDNSFVYCPFCRREHGSISCKRFQQLREEVAGRKDKRDDQSTAVVQRNAKMCPSCKMPIQKDGGCNFMDCPNCRRHFCWSCGRILRGSHQSHDCDAGFEGSAVISRTPGGLPSVELTRLFTNVLDIDHVELLNVEEADLDTLRTMLVPGLHEEDQTPKFVGPSECDGELLLRLPFNFQKSISWELTHIMLRAVHPPAPRSRPPRSLALLANSPSATFTDFDDPTVTVVDLEDNGKGALIASLEHLRFKGLFRRVTCLALRLSVRPAGACGGPGGEAEPGGDGAEVYFNDIALFGVPSDAGASAARRSAMWDERANLIVSPAMHKRRWGEEVEDGGDGEDAAPARVAAPRLEGPAHGEGAGRPGAAGPAAPAAAGEPALPAARPFPNLPADDRRRRHGAPGPPPFEDG